MTDSNWPPFERVNPLLHLTYSDVWHILRSLSLPYCRLYDLGYTSIGNIRESHPNPALRFNTSDGTTSYRPAYLLEDESLERQARQLPEA
ncbi:unnamed protein product [Protopolystoma xenopodis]|uniref:FAD synthase n=1 Tax=Protopolystoma xenopodis TaxID=117903 RepID=A0A3S5FFF5_9PLAT|nr:unnamed protein product [Protopolystoma xenopodis]